MTEKLTIAEQAEGRVSRTGEAVEIIPLANEEHWHSLRAADITSTDIAALFDCSPYITRFELWHRKRDGVAGEFEPTERMRWGNRLESAIADGVAEESGSLVRPMKDYRRLPDLRLGSSFDYQIIAVDDEAPADWPRDAAAGNNPGILEIKNVDGLQFRDGWIIDDGEGNKDIEAPLHIELQVQHQMLVSGYRWAVIAALVGGNEVKLIYRKADEQVHRAILKRAAQFWTSIDAGDEPAPDFARDLDTIQRLYGIAEPGKLVDLTSDQRVAELVEQHYELGQVIRDQQKDREALKAELLTLIGDAEKVLVGQHTISAGVVGEKEISFTRKPYRNFRITRKKTPAEKAASK